MTYTDVPYASRRVIADFCTFFQKIPPDLLQEIVGTMQRLTLPHILVQPHIIREAMYDIENNDD
jgi:hypothetical protein